MIKLFLLLLLLLQTHFRNIEQNNEILYDSVLILTKNRVNKGNE